MTNAAALQAELDFKHLFQALPGLYLVLSPQLHVLAVSEAYLQATHSTRTALQGQYLFDLFPENPATPEENSQGAVKASLQHVLCHREPHLVPEQRYDVRNQSGSFESRYWRIHSVPVLREDGEIHYIIHEVRDISGQVRAAREMKASKDSIRLLTNAAGGTTWECDLTTNTFTWGSAYKALFGYSEEDLHMPPQRWEQLTHPDDYALVQQAFRKVMAVQERVFSMEYRFRKADGTYADVLSCGYVLYNEAGKPLRLVGSIMDLSRQKEHEREAEESNMRFERIAMATNDVIWDWNLRSDTLWWNEGFKTIFGYGEEEINPSIASWEQRIHPEDRERVEGSIKEVIRTGGNLWSAEYRFRCADSSYKLIFDKGYVLHDHEQQPIRMVGAMDDITEKRRHEQQLAASLDWTKMVMESLPLMTWTSLADGTVDYFNQRWYEYTGSSFEDMKSGQWLSNIHPDDVAHTRAAWQRSLETGEPLVMENRWKSAADGKYRWFLVRAVPLQDAEGRITRWIGTNTDIESHKQAQLELEESNRKFRLLAESIPHVIWSANPDGNVDYFNQQWYDLTQMREEETLGLGWGPAVHPEDRAAVTDAWQHAMRTGEKYEQEMRLRNFSTGHYRWVLARALPIRNTEGAITKWYGTATDIHEQKVLREQVQESERKFRFLAESIPQIVWSADSQGQHDYFNKRWVDYTGKTMEESLGSDWTSILHPEDVQRVLARWQYSLQTGSFYEAELRLKNGYNDTYHWFLAQAMPMHNASGEVVKWFGSCTDIEDHKRAEEELVEKNLELERINQDLDSFVYTASHDLKLPIVNIAGIFEELLRSASFADPEAPVLIGMFNKALQQLHTTINELSEVVKVQKTKTRAIEQLPLQEVTDEVLISVQDSVRATGARITTDFAAASDVLFTRASLKSVLYNLLTNAIKYKSSERAPEICLRSALKGDYVELRVTDNGLGIDLNKHQNKLFQMFKRFHSHVSGSGLGLYIVNRLLTNHGGHINIESTLDQGTTFYLYFKQKQAAPAAST